MGKIELKSSLLILIFLISILIPLPANHSDIIAEEFDNNVISSMLAPHDPVNITCDEDFVTQLWPGHGNETHPYLIQGLDISSEGPCIEIRNVSVHYLISDCSLSGTRDADTGALNIYGYNEFFERVSSNGTVSMCDIFNSTIGIRVSANDFVIEQNTIWNCSSHDMKIWGHGVEVIDNELNTEGHFSLEWKDSVNSSLIGNNFFGLPHEDHYEEVRLYREENFIMSGNVFVNTRVTLTGTDLYLYDNSFFAHDYNALHIGGSNVTIEACIFGENEEYTPQLGDWTQGLWADGLINSKIIGCTGSDTGFTIGEDSINVTISGNTFSNSSFLVSGHGFMDIYDNVFSDSRRGIFLSTLNGSGFLHDNTFSGCETGIWLNSENYIIRNNTISNNEWGIIAIESNNHIFYNTFIGNSYSAQESEATNPINIWDDSVSMGNYWDRYFTVNDRWPVYIDDTPPNIVAIDPVVVTPGSNVTLNFTAIDNTPFYYIVTLDDVTFSEGAWDGSSVLVELNSLTEGTHNVEIVFSDINGNSASLIVTVTIQGPVSMLLIGIGIAIGAVCVVVILVLKRR
ncbi:MAG: NosD domain-containing protein [Candidatus Thorarchaeota archaeon]